MGGVMSSLKRFARLLIVNEAAVDEPRRFDERQPPPIPCNAIDAPGAEGRVAFFRKLPPRRVDSRAQWGTGSRERRLPGA